MEFDSDDESKLCELECSPINPPRKGIHGEQVFFDKWRELMVNHPSPWFDAGTRETLSEILQWNAEDLTQRHATVATTFILWLGTRCGCDFIETAKRLATTIGDTRNAYIMTWAVENHRLSCINHGYRAIELILEPGDIAVNRRLIGGYETTVKLDRDDYEVIEALVGWLGSEEGFNFVNECTAQLADVYRAIHIHSAIENGNFKHAAQVLSIR